MEKQLYKSIKVRKGAKSRYVLVKVDVLQDQIKSIVKQNRVAPTRHAAPSIRRLGF